jgi:5-methyltetrahydropteroyltriglutamate--homocysteine methyltransferase
VDVLTSSAGSYPRIGERPGQQRLRRAYAQLETGSIAASTYSAIEDTVAADVVAEQLEADLDLVTDGLVRWYDPISHVARALSGVTINGLLRYFDNNFYFRQPVVRDRIARVRSIVAHEYRFVARKSPRPVKAVLTGPYTLARASFIDTSAYAGVEALTLAYADVLAQELDDLAKSGATHVQLDEPAILRAPDAVGLLARALQPIAAAKGSAELTLATPFGDAAPVLRELAGLPIDVLAVDLASAPDLVHELGAVANGTALALGIVDGRNTRLESVEAAADVVRRVRDLVKHGPLYVTSSCGLELLPRASARRKLERVVAIADAVRGRRR